MAPSSFERLLHALSFPLTADDRQRLAQAYETLRSPTRVLVQETGRALSALTLAHLDSTVYVVEKGLLHVFDLPPDADPMKQSRDALTEAYQAHRLDPDAQASDPCWPLTMDARTRSRLNGWGGETELMAIFNAAGLATDSLRQRIAELSAQKPPQWQDAWDEHVKDRQLHHQKQADDTLTAVRAALPDGLLDRLNRFDLGVGELAHWVMVNGADHLAYRLQAIEQHPYLLSRALMASGQWALPRDRMRGLTPGDRQPSPITATLRAQGQILANAIDAGQSWTAHLLPIVNDPSVALYSQWRHQEHRHTVCTNHGCQLMLADVQILAGKPPEQSFTWMMSTLAPNYSVQLAMLSGLRELSARRRPKTLTAARRLATIVERNQDRIGERGKGLDAFFKGLPDDLDDALYQEMDRRWPLVKDTQRWMIQGAFRHVQLMQAFRAMTWQQMNKFADRAHDIEIQLRQPVFSDEPLRWAPSLRAAPVAHEGLQLHELCTETELKAEGYAMTHCVGGYGVRAGLGKLRFFSVRNEGGQRLSTLSVERSKETGSAVIEQHYGPHNKAPPALAQQAVDHWMTQAGALFKPERWIATPEAEERLRQETHAVLPRTLWEEACRRYPGVLERYQRWVAQQPPRALAPQAEPEPPAQVGPQRPEPQRPRRR
jgi:hypothetical protein